MKYFLTAITASLLISPGAFARVGFSDSGMHLHAPVQKFYVGNGVDGAVFSSATIKYTTPTTFGSPVTDSKMGTLRFTYFLNYGLSFNFNLNRHWGVYTGVDIKNLGFIERDSVTVKRRTYNVGVPVGIKIGNMVRKGNYAFFGGGVDVPANYREKSFKQRGHKTKFNEWFSDRTPLIMPYIFAGASIHHGISLKVQYYPGNFLNPEFATSGVKPYLGYDVHLFFLSVSFTTRYGKNRDIIKKHVAELNTM